MNFFVRRGKFLKIASGATLLALAPTLALQAQGGVNEKAIKATKSVIEKLLGKNSFLKFFCGVSLVVILFLLCKIVSFKSGKSHTFDPGKQARLLNSIVSENKDLDDAAKNLEKNKPKKGEKNNISVKENEGNSILNKEKKKVGSKKVENDILKR